MSGIAAGGLGGGQAHRQAAELYVLLAGQVGTRRGVDPEEHRRALASTWPWGRSRPATIRMSVLLPEPLRPMTPIASPLRATKETPVRARTTTPGGRPMARRSARTGGGAKDCDARSADGTR